MFPKFSKIVGPVLDHFSSIFTSNQKQTKKKTLSKQVTIIPNQTEKWTFPHSVRKKGSRKIRHKWHISEKMAAELKLCTIFEYCSLINILNPNTSVRFALQSPKKHTENLYFDSISINIDFQVKILLIKVKEHEILYKMVSFISVLGLVLIKIII